MTPRTGATAPGDDSFRRGRLAKATEFLDAADVLRAFGGDGGVLSAGSQFANAFVTQCVLSGIAAADAICVARTGRYSRSGAHDEAVPVLSAAAGPAVAKHLEVLLTVKTKAEYNARSVSDGDIVRAGEAAEALEAAARSV
ncbi:hypothetical protein [Curtobacterium sp. MCLR17_054]|uniref:hypothetical protein n=1 Tax=Curtobacterium sp. MCLR17_054 TaxID=2175632 RepID=UPI000DA80AFA|nr:hypothetical protein [Curtobacterium sp. MCLR17_054]WIE69066.1 DNA-binding protein [Curtobacterium sp. MCLR17_054]